MKKSIIINGKIFPVTSAPIERGYIVIENGKISGVFGGTPDFSLDGYEIHDVGGKFVYPGFVDAHTHIGMWEDGLGFEGDDGNEDTDPATPQMRSIDAVNPFDRCFSEALEAGVTTVVTGPGSANPIGGQMCALKTYGGLIEDKLVKAPLAMKMALGENPKTVYNGKNQTPTTRMATAAIIREQLVSARRYFEDVEKAEKDPELDAPEYDAKLEALIPVIKGELAVHFHAHRLDDMFTAKRIADEFNLDYIIVHGTGAHVAPELVAKSGMRVLCGPLLCDRSKPEMKDLTPANPYILHEHGVELAIITDHPVIPEQYLTLCAALAVREGLGEAAALNAITAAPARLCGIADRVGSLEAGKDADIVVFEKSPFVSFEKPFAVFAGGVLAAKKSDNS